MNRRKFLNNSLSGLLAFSLPGINGSLPKAKKKKIPVAAHVWVFAATLPGRDISPELSRIFSDVSYAGFDGVESMEQPLRSKEYTKQIGELIEQYRIGLTGISYGGDMWDKKKSGMIYEDADLVLTNVASVGGKTFGVSVGQVRGRMKTEDELDTQAELLKRLVSLCRSKGITLNLHNHTYEVENNLHDLRGTLKRIPDIGLGPDLNWLLRAGVDPIGFLKEFRKNIVFLHLRDQLNNGKWPESLGEGDVNFNEIGRTLDEIRFNGVPSIELAHESGFVPTRPLRESLKMSREYVRKTMGI
jgi:sugar phosphate isomerase/epimerase